DLRWHVTDATVEERDLTLEVTDAQGRHAREVRLPLAQIGSREVDAQLLQRIGLGGPYSEPVLGTVMEGGAAAAAGLRAGDRVRAVD
ncbi:RIP metalloprotease RseP, partial [Escherichia coli]|nr:RIP metalloprotease RseP [Escherichia coli]